MFNIGIRFYTDYLIYKDIKCDSDESQKECVIFWTAAIVSVALAVLMDTSYMVLFFIRRGCCRR